MDLNDVATRDDLVQAVKAMKDHLHGGLQAAADGMAQSLMERLKVELLAILTREIEARMGAAITDLSGLVRMAPVPIVNVPAPIVYVAAPSVAVNVPEPTPRRTIKQIGYDHYGRPVSVQEMQIEEVPIPVVGEVADASVEGQ